MTASWRLRSISDVCRIQPPKSEARYKVSGSSLVSFLPMEQLGIDQKIATATQSKPLAEVAGSYTYFADGDVLLAKITPCFENGKLGIAQGLENGIGFGSSEYIVLRPDATLSSEWLYYFLARDSFREEGARRMTGAVGHKRVPKEFVENYQIPMPSIAEQRRIVAILDKAFESIAIARADAEKNLQNVRELFESHLEAELGRTWKDGQLKKLSDLAEEITDGDHMPPPKSGDGVPFITIGNIDKRTRTIALTDTFKVPNEYFQNLKPNRRPMKGDVLYTVTGSYGVPVLIAEDTRFCFQRHIALVRPRPGIDSQWLYWLLASPQIRRQADSGATGAAQKTVSLKLLRGFQVPVVTRAHQVASVTLLNRMHDETQRLESIYRRKLAALDELKQSLLHQAFSGQL